MRGHRGISTSLLLGVFALAALLLVQPSPAAQSDADEVVLVEPGGKWHIRQPGQADYVFWYGVAGDVPLLGDWDGDGWDTPGMYRPSSGFVYLTNTLPPNGGVGFGDPSLTFFFGIPGDQVVVGDWDKDGKDTLGIRRNGRMYLTNRNATGIADVDFWFGHPADLGFGGDADGDGEDVIFVYRPQNSFVYYTNVMPAGSGTVAFTNGEFYFGVPTDRFVIGDWDGDGDDTVGVYRPAETRVYLRNTLNTGPADVAYAWGHSSWMPVAGRVQLTPATYELTTSWGAVSGSFVESEPPGISCANSRSAICTAEFPAGTEVTLIATPESGYQFDQWIGGTCGSANPCTFTMNSDLVITPTWEVKRYRLQVNPTDGGMVNSDPGGITNCSTNNPTGCTSDFTTGSWVTLTPTPDAGFEFSGWTDSACSAYSGPCTVLMTEDRVVSPVFVPDTTLPIRVNAGGPLIATSDGHPWLVDTTTNPSPFGNFDQQNTTVSWPTPQLDSSVPPGTPAEIFTTERWDHPDAPDMHWNIPVEADQWVEVRLYFASGYPGASDIAERLFDVTIDDWPVLDDYDIVADVGHQVGVMKRFIVRTDGDGLNIDFAHTDPAEQNPLINAIEIVQPDRLRIVPAAADPATGGAQLLTALAEVAAETPESDSPWIIKVLPGVYQPSEPIVLAPYVELEGSGRAVTTIIADDWAGRDPRAVVLVGENATIRHVGIEATDDEWSPTAIGILSRSSSRLESVAIDLDGIHLTGVRVEGGSPSVRDIYITSEGTSTMTGISFVDATPNVANLDLDIHSSSNGRAVALTATNSTFDLSHSRLTGFNHRWGSTGLSLSQSDVRAKDVLVQATGGFHPASALNTVASTLDLEDVTATAHVWGGPTTAARFTDSAVTMQRSSLTATDGDPPFLMDITGSTVTMSDVIISSFEETYQTGRGITLEDGSQPVALFIERSTVSAPDWIATNNSTGTVTFRDSILNGGPMLGSGSVTCQNVWDEHGTFYPNTCPN